MIKNILTSFQQIWEGSIRKVCTNWDVRNLHLKILEQFFLNLEIDSLT